MNPCYAWDRALETILKMKFFPKFLRKLIILGLILSSKIAKKSMILVEKCKNFDFKVIFLLSKCYKWIEHAKVCLRQPWYAYKHVIR